MIKYIPVFGSQELFDGAPECAELVGHSGGFYRITPDGVVYCGGCTFTTDEYRNLGFIAMRRIEETPEPKRWTIEDQNAGRLPEVGCRVVLCFPDGYELPEYMSGWESGDEIEILRLNGNIGVAAYNHGVFGCANVSIRHIKPIETPEEKALRLEREFVQSFCTNDVVYERGLRDAYRKLNNTKIKGTEQ